MTSCKNGNTVKLPENNEIVNGIKKIENEGKIPKIDKTDTLLGQDLNNNNVRDDIEKYIESLPINSIQKDALISNAKLFQNILSIEISDERALGKISQDMADSLNCIITRFDKFDGVYSIVTSLEKKTFNTEERSKKYVLYNKAQSGSVTQLPSGDTCINTQ